MSKATKNRKEHVAIFTERWNTWKAHLDELVQANNGKLICPEGRELVKEYQEKAGDINGSIKINLPYPICLYNIPKKTGRKGRETLTIFIDGNYELEEDPAEHIRRITSQVFFYELIPRTHPELRLLDAYHCDLFEAAKIKEHAPHPAFHVQRELRASNIADIELRFNTALDQLSGKQVHSYKHHTEKEISQLFRFGTFRIPTPQLDILNLGAVVAADKLVGIEESSPKHWQNFQALLNTIHGSTGGYHHVKKPKKHDAKIFNNPRKQVADWYSNR